MRDRLQQLAPSIARVHRYRYVSAVSMQRCSVNRIIRKWRVWFESDRPNAEPQRRRLKEASAVWPCQRTRRLVGVFSLGTGIASSPDCLARVSSIFFSHHWSAPYSYSRSVPRLRSRSVRRAAVDSVLALGRWRTDKGAMADTRMKQFKNKARDSEVGMRWKFLLWLMKSGEF